MADLLLGTLLMEAACTVCTSVAERQRAMSMVGSTHRAERFYGTALEHLARRGIPYLIGGAYAMREYAGIFRDTKDLDVFCRPADAPRVLRVLGRAGYRTEMTDAVWLAKAFHGDHFIDVIFSSGNGLCRVDDTWFRYARDVQLFGRAVKLIPPEELIWSKAYVQTRTRYDGADIAHIIRQHGTTLNWQRLLERMEPDWEVLLLHLLNFRYVYPSERAAVPRWLMWDLWARVERQLRDPPPRERVTRGPLLAPYDYAVDTVEWGYRDVRALRGGESDACRADRRAGRRSG